MQQEMKENQERMQQELKEHHESMLQENFRFRVSHCRRWAEVTTALDQRQTGLEKKQAEIEQHLEGLHSQLNDVKVTSKATVRSAVSDISDRVKMVEKYLMENRQLVVAKEDSEVPITCVTQNRSMLNPESSVFKCSGGCSFAEQ